MNTWNAANQLGWLLLAQRSALSGVGDRFSVGGSDVPTSHIVGLVMALIAVGVVLWLVARAGAKREGRGYRSPRRLFRELCRLHDINWHNRRLLRRLARFHKLPHPAQVFLEPAFLDPAKLGTAFRTHRQRLVTLQRQLFAAEEREEEPTEVARPW